MLSGSEGGSSDAEEVTLAFIKRTLTQCPEVFVQPLPETGQSQDSPAMSQIVTGAQATQQKEEYGT